MYVDLRAAHLDFLLRALGCHVVYFTSTYVISSTIHLFCGVCLFVCHRQNSNFSVSCINEGRELVLTDTHSHLRCSSPCFIGQGFWLAVPRRHHFLYLSSLLLTWCWWARFGLLSKVFSSSLLFKGVFWRAEDPRLTMCSFMSWFYVDSPSEGLTCFQQELLCASCPALLWSQVTRRHAPWRKCEVHQLISHPVWPGLTHVVRLVTVLSAEMYTVHPSPGNSLVCYMVYAIYYLHNVKIPNSDVRLTQSDVRPEGLYVFSECALLN